MYRKEVNAHSPLRLLEQSIHGGLGPGNLGVILARAGVGKTAFLVQLGLDDVLRERNVLHVSLDGGIDEVRAWYDSLLHDLSKRTGLRDPSEAKLLLERHRMIQTYNRRAFSAQKLSGVVGLLAEHAKFKPTAILIDGLTGSEMDRDQITGLKALAASCQAELWVTALTHRHEMQTEGQTLPMPAGAVAELVDVALVLQPQSKHVDLRLLKDHDSDQLAEISLSLTPDTMRLQDTLITRAVPAPDSHQAVATPTLYSGGAAGTEAAFGEIADRYGITEQNFTFPGHNPAREVSQVHLSERELRQGDVSLSYVSQRMGRRYASSQTFRRILQTIWHQVNRAQEIYVIGIIQPDNTVKGGTGWGAELARVWNKPLWVFDQERRGWFHWTPESQEWTSCHTPTIGTTSFCGTGTRFLSDEGRQAIEDLMAGSFG